MKKKVIIITAVVILVLGIGGTCAGLVWKNSNQEPKQEEQVAELGKDKKTVDSKEPEEKKTDEAVSTSEIGAIETVASEKAVENSVLNNGTSEKATDSSINSPVESTPNGNQSNNSSSTPSGNHNNNSSSTPTGNTSPTGGGNSSGNGTNSNSGNNSNNNTSTQPVHTHTWVHIDATGHYETITIQEAWDEEVPVYENIPYSICNQCGADITNNIDQHFKDSGYVCGGYHTEWRYEQTGIQTVHHEAVTENKYVQDSAEYHVCSECGATTDCNCTRSGWQPNFQ